MAFEDRVPEDLLKILSLLSDDSRHLWRGTRVYELLAPPAATTRRALADLALLSELTPFPDIIEIASLLVASTALAFLDVLIDDARLRAALEESPALANKGALQ